MDEGLSVMEKAVAAIKWCSPPLIATWIFYWRVVVCGRLFQLLTEISPGCLVMALVPGSAESVGIGHANPCTVQATLHCHHLKNKFLLALRKAFNGEEQIEKITINQCSESWLYNMELEEGSYFQKLCVQLRKKAAASCVRAFMDLGYPQAANHGLVKLF